MEKERKAREEEAKRESAEAMWGPFRSGVRPFFFLASFASFCLGNSAVLGETSGDFVPTIHPVPINETLIPHEYIKLPLVAKCCKLNQVLAKNESSEEEATCTYSNSTENEQFLPLFDEFNATGLMLPHSVQKEFVAVVGDPCRHKRYMLEPSESDEDEYYLLLNGSIYAPFHKPLMLMPGIDYCMEVAPPLGLRVFVCFPDETEVAGASDSLITFYACGLLISVPFLLLTIAAYAITPRLMDVHGKALCHYCACLALAFTTLAVVQLASAYTSDEICISIAFVIQFSFVACFFWLNVMCIETYLLVRRHVERGSNSPRIEPRRLFFYYSLWAWGPPAVLILISIFMDLSPTIPMTYVKPNFADHEAMPYFYVPVGILVCINLILFAMTAVGITRYQRDLDLRRMARNQESDREEQRLFRRLKRIFFVCLGLFFLMGMNWAMELISWWAGGDPLAWSAFDLVNALQGVLVFGLFVLRKPVRNIVWCRIQKLRGIETTEPELGSMALYLLPVINGGDTLPRERIS
ncbi:G-protein coupled receptor Mth2 isoform X2 [Nasonia vitripennis]|uniref:G-protein coupled receptors family 2 profile 2 domain-containing protein n=1 Tax=Nasonia vitripennis TaxID=7425 RepID=A0A7M7QJL0_NASVI|nr:G-protein coupled receptor Mth2 isoform X2 [Nasonia vitripennis]